jgi:GTP diphosphokinase / guanosine-3',5'-bis(diphosphate) 3'-diphosphatase
MIWDQEKYVKAWNFASVAHQGQLVPGTKNPYINHIGLVVMEALATVSNSENIDNPNLLIQCALLHDTIEDTDLEYDDIEYEFGREIADGVLALTKNKKLKTKVEKMTDSLSRIKQQPEEVWMVKLCDRITNLQPPPVHWGKDKIEAYYYESISILNSLGVASDFLQARLKEKIENYKYY